VENNVLALPVLTQKGEYYGLVEIFDIVRFVTEMFSDISNTSMVDLERLFASDTKFSNTLVSEVMQWPLKKNNPFHPVTKGYSLFSAWEILALSEAKRVPVIDVNSQIADIVTQSMMVDFLWQNLEMIGKLADKKIQDIQLLRNHVVTQVDENSKAIVAFREMVNRQEDHVAVVNKSGQLVDNLSLRDLRGIRPDVKVFYRLWSTVAEFKARVREEFPEKTPSGLMFVLQTDTLFQVVEIMAVKHVHHVFVVENATNLKPVRVITQTDILREIVGK
jgi:CBS domain-containing protein